MNEKTNELINSSKENSRDSELIIQDLSKRLIHDLNIGRGDYIEWRNDYLQEFDGSDKFPNKIAYDMIEAGRGDEVLKHIDKFEPTQTLAKALLGNMLKNGFYENKDSRAEGYSLDYLLEDSIIQWESFLSRFKKLDNSTALLVLRLLERNMYEGADAIYMSRLGDCFILKYFVGLDEDVLRRLSERGVIIKDEDKNRFVGIDQEKWEKYTKIAIMVQDKVNEERDKLDKELNEME